MCSNASAAEETRVQSGRELGERRTLGLGNRFSRRCLENVPLKKVEGPHQGDVGLGEATAMPGGEVVGQERRASGLMDG